MEEQRYFQWLLTDRQGQVVVFDRIEEDDNEIFVVFKDGTRCNQEFILPLNEKKNGDKVMAEVENTSNIWKFQEEWVGREEEMYETNADGEKVCVQPLIPGRKVFKFIPPRSSVSKFGELRQEIRREEPKIEPKIEQTREEIKQIENSSDPVWLTLNKSKKQDAEINLVLNLKLPSKDLYKLLKENFDEGDKKTIEYIISHIEIDEIKNSLGTAIQSMYEEEPIN